MKNCTIAIAMSGWLMLNLLSVHAQDIPRYAPRRPTVSPYLNLLRNDFGPLPNYYSLVRPQLNQQAFDNQISAATKQNSIAVQRLSTLSTESQGRSATGTDSVYSNYSHYYRHPLRKGRRR